MDIYDSFSVFVFPSLYEGLGFPIIEAYARGLPIVIWKYGVMPDEIRKCCFEAENEADMARILVGLKEKPFSEEMRKAMVDYIKDFTWENAAKETVKVYEELA